MHIIIVFAWEGVGGSRSPMQIERKNISSDFVFRQKVGCDNKVRYQWVRVSIKYIGKFSMSALTENRPLMYSRVCAPLNAFTDPL